MIKPILNTLAVVLILVLVRCTMNESVSGREVIFKGSAKLGWYGKVAVVNISDHRGEEFMMQYKLYRTIFYTQGYNGVVKYYYEHPYDERLYLNKNFQPSKAYDADTMSKSFDSSYMKAVAGDSLYMPKAKIITKSLSIRKQRFGNSYNPSTAKPI